MGSAEAGAQPDEGLDHGVNWESLMNSSSWIDEPELGKRLHVSFVDKYDSKSLDLNNHKGESSFKL